MTRDEYFDAEDARISLHIREIEALELRLEKTHESVYSHAQFDRDVKASRTRLDKDLAAMGKPPVA